MSTARSNKAHALPAAEPVRPELRVLETDPRSAQRRRAMDDWFLAVMIVVSCLFAGAFVRYVLYPAAASVSSSSASTSFGDGP